MMAMNMAEARVKITAQTAGQENIAALKKQIEGLSSTVHGIGQGFERAGTLIKGAFALEAVKMVGDFINKSIELGDHINDLSQKFGVSVEAISTFQGAGATAGADLETIAKSFGKLSKAAVEAATGSKQAGSAFATLGLSVKDSNGNIKDAGTLSLEVADKFSKMQDGSAKAALAMKLFGKAGADMIPTLNMGSEAILQFGSVMSGDFARMADAFNDKVAGIERKFQRLSIVGATALMPTLNDIIDGFSGLEAQGPSAVTFFDGVGELARLAALALGEVYFAIMDVGGALVTASKQAWELAHGNWEKVKQLGRERDANQAARNASEKAFLEKMTANSLIFGKGTTAEIKARQRASFAPPKARGLTGTAPDLAALDTSAADKAEQKLKEFEAALGGLQGKAAQLNFQIAHFAEYGDKVSSANGALMRFETTQGKFKDDTDDQKKALVGAADAADAASEKYDKLVKSKTEMDDLNKAKVGWARQLEGLKDEALAANMSALAFKQLTDRKTELARIEEQVAKYEPQTAAAYRETALAALDARQEVERINDAFNNSFKGASQNAIAEYGKEIANVGGKVQDAWGNALKGTEDALVNFVTTGKLSFKDLANSIIRDLVRIAIQQTIMKAINAGISAVTGGFSPAGPTAGSAPLSAPGARFAANGAWFDGGVSAFASGGVFNKPTMFAYGGSKLGIMGEAGPEAIMPLKRGANGSLGVVAQGGGGVQNITVNVSAQGDTQASGDQGKASDLGKAIAAAVQKELVQQKRPGGLLAA
jgi:hypothetical protein